MESNKDLLTLGQASCLALSLPPTDENRKEARRILSNSPFEVTYLKDSGPMTPVAIGKNTKQLNPFLYLSYPETPPLSSDEYSEGENDIVNITSTNHANNKNLEKKSHKKTSNSHVSLESKTKKKSTIKSAPPRTLRTRSKTLLDTAQRNSNLDTNIQNTATLATTHDSKRAAMRILNPSVEDETLDKEKSVSRKKVLNFAKRVFLSKCPVQNSPHYDYMFVTSPSQLNIVKQHFNSESLTQKKLARWIGMADFLSYMITYQGIRGRWLYVMKKQYRDFI